MKKIIIFIGVLIFATWGCEKDPIIDTVVQENVFSLTPDTITPANQTPDTDTVKGVVLFEFYDIDSNLYHAIKIGSQIWSQENLKTTHFNDGTPIPYGTTLIYGAYCHYNHNSSKSAIYGLLYNYYAVASNKLAPKGWHVATTNDWETLLTEVEIIKPNYDIDVGPLVDAKDWSEPFYVLTRSYEERMVTCTNSTLFTALPNGYRDDTISSDYHEFDCMGVQASWWTSSGRIIYVDGSFGIFPRDDRPYNVGSGVRIVKDSD